MKAKYREAWSLFRRLQHENRTVPAALAIVRKEYGGLMEAAVFETWLSPSFCGWVNKNRLAVYLKVRAMNKQPEFVPITKFTVGRPRGASYGAWRRR